MSKHLEHRIRTNFIWNLTGGGLPLVVAIISIPLLIDSMGVSRFGLLTLSWILIGYFSVFDLGIARALTKLLAEKLSNDANKESSSIVFCALVLLAILGCIAGIILNLITPWLLNNGLNIEPDLKKEAFESFFLISITIPLVIVTAGLIGVLEAYQRFKLVNYVRIPLGISTYLVPLLALQYVDELDAIVLSLSTTRFIALILYALICLRVASNLVFLPKINRTVITSLINLGSWMTVSNVISPLMTYMDRFIIGGITSMASVTYYTTPYEISARLGLIASALARTLFPTFSAVIPSNIQLSKKLHEEGSINLYLILFPLVLTIVVFAENILKFWLGPEFGVNSTLVLQLLAIGMLVNGQGQLPFAFIQASGRPDITAKLHLIELLPYLLFLWGAVNMMGINGAAFAWLLRVSADTFLLNLVARKIADPEFSAWSIIVNNYVISSIVALLLAIIAKTLFIKVALYFTCLGALGFCYLKIRKIRRNTNIPTNK